MNQNFIFILYFLFFKNLKWKFQFSIIVFKNQTFKTFFDQSFQKNVFGMVAECKIIDLTTQEMKLEEGYHVKPSKDYKGEGNLELLSRER